MLRSVIAYLLTASAAFASCPNGQSSFLTCQIEGKPKVMQACYDAEAAHYSFGPRGGPAELALSETYETLGYTPWPGVGRSIWETVTFTNGDYRYVVNGGVDRMFGDEAESENPHPQFGSVTVFKGEKIIAELACDPATVSFSWSDNLYDYKEAAGFEWDYRDRVWRARR
ncbi:MAG: hypothetical protein AB3N15_01390 [Paracoccaceae bacterium]